MKHKKSSYRNLSRITTFLEKICMGKITHIDLFSGIGGFSLAIDKIYGKKNVIHQFCEIDPFCQAVLKKNFPDSEIWGDIRTFTYANNGEQQEQQECGSVERKSPSEPRDSAWSRPSARNSRRGSAKRVRFSQSDSPFLLTGGFPCQPFSTAGVRKGTDDSRHLWPEMFRVISEFRPTWVIAENVRGLLTIQDGMVFEQVLADLESIDYEVQAFVIPACAVGAPHRRERVWIVAKNTKHNGGGIGEHEKLLGIGNKWYTRAGDEVGVHRETNASDTQNARLERRSRDRPQKTNTRFGQSSRDTEWNQNWFEVATRLCRMDDGLSEKLVRLPDGTKISYSRWRKEALKAYGNSIVPAIAMKILEAIRLSCEKSVSGV